MKLTFKMMSPQEAERIMKETTEKELKKLNKSLQENPSVLHKKPMSPIFKKTVFVGVDNKLDSSDEFITSADLKIEKLEKENYYQKLELSNLGVENGDLKKEIETLNANLSEKNNTILFVRRCLMFLEIVFEMEIIEGKSVKELKSYFLQKAQEFNKIEEQYTKIQELSTKVEKSILDYFNPRVEYHYIKIKEEYDSNKTINTYIDYAFYIPIILTIFTGLFITFQYT